MSAAVETTPQMPPEEHEAAERARESERQRSIAEFFRETWSQALVAVSATEEEAQKILGKMTNWVEMGPEEARRLGQELSERLRRERDELEGTIEVAVRRALAPFRLPAKEELNVLHARLTEIEARIDRLAALRAGVAVRAGGSDVAQ